LLAECEEAEPAVIAPTGEVGFGSVIPPDSAHDAHDDTRGDNEDDDIGLLVDDDEAPPPLEPANEWVSRRRQLASIGRLLTYSPAIPACPGCRAKSKSQRHCRKAFKREAEHHLNEVSLDQVTMSDVDGTIGIGSYRRGIVQCRIAEDFWTFELLKSQDETTTLTKFKEFAYRFCAANTIGTSVCY
jgi:hypothetical protein